ADASRIVVINPGVDLPADSAAAPDPSTRGIDSRRRPTIVTVARMVDEYKGHDVMIAAIDLLRRRGLEPRWIVAGDGPLRARYEREVRDRGLGALVTFTGTVGDRRRDDLLDRADVFAMPSRVPPGGGGEGFGLVFLEAAARGLPVVAGDQGGAVDAVRQGETGLLVDPRSAEAVADALAQLLTDAGVAAQMSANARRHAAANSWSGFAERVRETLVEAIGRPGAPVVLAVSHTAAVGGAERSLLTQARSDAGEGVRIVVVSPTGPLGKHSRDCGLEFAEGPAFERSFRVSPLELPLVAFDLLRCGAKLAAQARRHDATVIHANSVRAGLIAAAARLFGGPPVITHVRDCMPDSRIANATRAVARRASSEIVANSRYTADSFGPTRGGAFPSVIYNALEAPFFDGSKAKRSGRSCFAGDGELLVVVGQITPWKGQDTAIRVLAALKPRLPAARLVLAGSVKFADGARHDNRAYAERLHTLARELGVAEDVVFAGELSDVTSLLADADVVLMPSWEEPFGRVAIEAMAAGRAVIATSVGGPGEFIDHRVNGLLADPFELTQWISATLELATDRNLREALGERARADVARRFAAGSAETRMLPVYRRVGAGRLALGDRPDR
ncbi:MAG: glycosyltransferase family 4 protein, partial [Solirubrobacterales bacterium]